MLNIYFGRESIDKERFMYETIANKGGRTLVIVPDQYTLEGEKQAFRLMKATSLIDVEILSMSRLGYRLLNRLGGSREEFIDKYGRHMLLSLIAKEEEENIKVFKGNLSMTSFIELLNDYISEMKQYDTSPEKIGEIIEKLPENHVLAKKLSDFILLYSKYEERIKGKYTDSEDYINLYMSKVKDSDLISESKIWIYGFDSFAPKSLQVIEELIKYAKEVNVVLTYDFESRDEDLFILTSIVKENLIKVSESSNSKWNVSAIPYSYKYEDKASAITTLERELFAVIKNTSSDFKGISVVQAANVYNEAESAASYILFLLREKKLRYRDIVVICNDQKVRASILKRVFSEYGISFFTDKKRGILNSPVIIFIVTLLTSVSAGYRTADIFRLLKTGFSGIESRDIEVLENYCIAYRIKGKMWKKPFVKGETELGVNGLEAVNEIRTSVVSMLEPIEEALLKAESVKAFTESFYKYLTEDVEFGRLLTEFATKQKEKGFPEIAAETVQIWDKFVAILDQIVRLIGNEKFDKEHYIDTLISGLDQVEVGVLPPTVDDILLGTMQRTRAGQAKAVLVVGANEGILPSENTEGGLFTLQELDFISNQGDEICKSDKIRTMEEQLAIYRNLTKPSEYLWISYSSADQDGKELRPSDVIYQIQRIFPCLKVTPDVLNRENPTEMMGGEINTLRHLTENLQRAKKGESIDAAWKPALNWYKENEKTKLDAVCRGLDFTNEQVDLPVELVGRLFKRDENKPLSVSPSRLEKFSRCPFSHFVAYGLAPKERRMFEASGREIGDLYHVCLMELSKILSLENKWEIITEEECRALVSSIVDGRVKGYRDGIFDYGNEEKYKTSRIKEACFYVSWALITHVRAGEIAESDYEVSFGRGKKIEAIEIETKNETLYIEGKIDRVDRLANSAVKIIDYKTGNDSFDIKEAEAGYRLQLMLYLRAASGKSGIPAGVFYFRIGDPKISLGSGDFYKSEKISQEIMKSFKLNGIMVDDAQTIKQIAGEFEKNSDIVPLKQKSNGEIVGTSANVLLSESDFRELQKKVYNKTVELCDELLSGRIELKPKKSGDEIPCEFCPYKSICRFDISYKGCKYEIVK